MMTRCLKLLAILAAIVICAVPAKLAAAHTLGVDGRISAYLHIAPDDKPKPGKVNDVYFYFDDQDFRLTMEGCDCSVRINEGKQVLYKGALQAYDNRVGKVSVLLPDNNFSYAVVASGTPKTAGFFQPFSLKFDIDVGKPPPAKPLVSHWKLAWAIIALGLLAAGAALYRLLRRRSIIKG